MVLNEKYKLNNGTEIPKLGLGTWMIPDNEVDSAVKSAVKLGYRLIDTAQAYGNESGVGSGIRSCGVSRDEMFVTSKVAAENKTYDSALSSIDESLKKTGLDYLDLMIIHSPQPWAEFRAEKRYFEENKEVWRALEDVCKAGKVKSIGVSNFLADDLQNILDDCKIKPAVNQILTHISNTPLELIKLCAENGILCEAYSPIAHGEALKNRVIDETAAKYNVEPAQLCVRYFLQLGMVALPKTANPEHMKSNADVDFVISDSDMDLLKNLEKIKDYGEYSFFPVFSGK
ncbi:MAG: aldo/keto reductase [Ruminococcus bromii]|nr:aldo/keto reductase [Ruminococcus bromii]